MWMGVYRVSNWGLDTTDTSTCKEVEFDWSMLPPLIYSRRRLQLDGDVTLSLSAHGLPSLWVQVKSCEDSQEESERSVSFGQLKFCRFLPTVHPHEVSNIFAGDLLFLSSSQGSITVL